MNQKCLVCGNLLTGRQRKYCSQKCKDTQRTIYHHVCEHCHRDFNSNEKKQNFCSHSCSSFYIMQSRDMSGSNNPNWKVCRNGRYPTENGYIILYKPEHPLSDKSGRVLEHRYIAYQTAPFPRTWDVHHIDFNKINNSPKNLFPMPKSEHAKLHNEKRQEEKSCL